MHQRSAFCVAATSVFASDAFAHCYVGARLFPATLATDAPCSADELSLPTVSAFTTSDDPPSNLVNISAELSKRITDTVCLTIGSTWSSITPPAMPIVDGFQNLERAIKWQFATLAKHEFVMSAGS